jgi:ABC-type amino acid transport substrate-binding protein
MAPRTRLILVLIGLVGAALIIWLAQCAAPTRETFPYGELRVGVDPSSPPFAAIGENGLFGLEIDLANELGTRLNLPVRFVTLGIDGLYDALKTDQVDILIANVLIDDTRLNDIHYSQPYFDAGLVLVSDRGITQMSQLPGHKLAFEFGSEADSEARTWLRRVLAFDTLPYERQQDALDAARLGDADAALVDSVSARLYLKAHPEFPTDFHQVTNAPYAVASQARRPEISVVIRATLQSIIDDGTLNALIDRWL